MSFRSDLLILFNWMFDIQLIIYSIHWDLSESASMQNVSPRTKFASGFYPRGNFRRVGVGGGVGTKPAITLALKHVGVKSQ